MTLDDAWDELANYNEDCKYIGFQKNPFADEGRWILEYEPTDELVHYYSVWDLWLLVDVEAQGKNIRNETRDSSPWCTSVAPLTVRVHQRSMQ